MAVEGRKRCDTESGNRRFTHRAARSDAKARHDAGDETLACVPEAPVVGTALHVMNGLVPLQIFDGTWPAERSEIARCGDERASAHRQHACRKLRHITRSDAHDRIVPARRIADAVVEIRGHLNGRVLRHERIQRCAEMRIAEAARRGNAHGTCEFAAAAGEFVRGFVRFRHDAFRTHQERNSIFGECELPAVALNEMSAERAFELRETFADGGLGKSQPTCGLVDRSAVSHRNEGGDAIELHRSESLEG